MLLEISIKNFAIIEEITLNFDNGMTVLTGETGAGKSIIIDAMNMMLGSRATTEVIRHGMPKAEIQGLFSLEKPEVIRTVLGEQGIEVGDELIIRRRGSAGSMAKWSICLSCERWVSTWLISMANMIKKS